MTGGDKPAWRSTVGRLRERLAAWLEHPRLPLHLALVAVALCLPALGTGWQSDDYLHRAVLRGDVESGYSTLELFSVMRFGSEVRQQYIDMGLFPWWTSERFSLAFFRYLSAAAAWIDYRLWPESAVLQHVHSLLWLGAVVVAATLFYRRIHGAGWTAGLAALLYAVDDAHGPPASWLANRNALIAAFFGLLCLLAHDRWRRRGGGAAAAALSALWLALALTAAELGLGTFGYLVAYAAFVEEGPARRRLASLVPSGAVLAVWVAVYRLLGFGAAGSGLYVDPLGQPLAFLGRLVERAPFYLAGQLTPLPAELGLLAPAGRLATARTLAVAALVVMVAILAPLVARRRTARFWALGAVLAVVPLCATFPSNRVLLLVGLGGMALVAQWLEGGWRQQEGRAAGWLARVVAVALVGTHLVYSPLSLPVTARAFQLFSEPTTQAILTLPRDEALVGEELVVVTAPDYLTHVTQAGAVLMLNDRPFPRTIRGLAIGPSAVTVRRTDGQTLELSMARGFLCGPLGELFRESRTRFSVGESFVVPGMTATVVAAASDGTPTTVRFRFDEPLESPGRRWVRFAAGAFVPFTAPPVGGSLTLPAARGPFDLLADRGDVGDEPLE